MGIFRTPSPGGSLSSNPERSASLRRWWENLGQMVVWPQRASSQNIERWLLIKENLIPQVKEFSAFLRTGRCKCLGLLKCSFPLKHSFHTLLSYPGQRLGFSTSSAPSGLTWGVVSVWWMLNATQQGLLFLSPLGLGTSRWRAAFEDKLWHPCLPVYWQAGNIPFLSLSGYHQHFF